MKLPQNKRWATVAFTVIWLMAQSTRAMAKPSEPAARVLFVLAHPDDETMVGGLLSRLDDLSVDTYFVYVTDGEGGDVHLRWRDGLATIPTPKLLMRVIRRLESTLALAPVTPKQTFWLQYPDTGYSTDEPAFAEGGHWDRERLRRQIAEIATQVSPTIVVVPGQQTRAHAHHKHVGRITNNLFRDGLLANAKQIYEFDETGWLDVRIREGDLVLPRRAPKVTGGSHGDFQSRISRGYVTQGPAHLRWLRPGHYDDPEVLRATGGSGADPLRELLARP